MDIDNKRVWKNYLSLLEKDISCYVEKQRKVTDNLKELISIVETLLGDAQHCANSLKVTIDRLNKEIGES